nr:hypothetical protein [Tanacetum cinerariifolium]
TIQASLGKRPGKASCHTRFIDQEDPPEVLMANNRTMAQLLQAPTVGYEDAIAIPEIAATNFELKHGNKECASWDLGKGTCEGREKGFGTVLVWCRCTGSGVGDGVVLAGKGVGIFGMSSDELDKEIGSSNGLQPKQADLSCAHALHELHLHEIHVVPINMDNPNITIEEYIRFEEEKAQKREKVFNGKPLGLGCLGLLGKVVGSVWEGRRVVGSGDSGVAGNGGK